MFCKVSYDYPLRDDHDSMGAINVIKAVNSTPNPIFNNDTIGLSFGNKDLFGIYKFFRESRLYYDRNGPLLFT